MGRGSPWFAGGNHPRFLFQPDAAAGYTLRPGFRGREIAASGEFEMPVAVDARGLRDHPHAPPPRPAVLALGDSMTFGEGVPVDRTWPAVLERESGVRVYNGGVPGYSTCQMAERAERLLPRLRPDLVVAVFSPSWDRARCATPFTYLGGYIVSQGYRGRLHLIDGDLYLAEVRWPVVGAATAHAKRRSYLARLALPALGGAARALRSRQEPRPPTGPEAFAPTLRALEALRGRARRSGAGFLAVLIESSREEAHAADRAALEAILHESDLPYVALDALLPHADWPRLRYAQDQHWNEAGHQAVGEALAPLIERRLGLAP